jgi:ribosomal protein S18 acetylase RimI-like enzyme
VTRGCLISVVLVANGAPGFFGDLTAGSAPDSLTFSMVHVRPFRRGDTRHVEQCFAELQSFEKSIEDNRVDGDAISSTYVRHLRKLCDIWDGRIFVAEQDDRVVGFVCVLANFDSKDMIEAHTRHAFITDLVVTMKLRSQGIGRSLLQEAESFALKRGASVLRLNVLAGNTTARAMYGKANFRELEIKMIKQLPGPE